jgi:hypothetical protein
MILLIFTARLIRLFRFVSTVTIMQQRYAALFGLGGTIRTAAKVPGHNKSKRITGPSPAKELGKRWRFFPTYAGV